MPPTPPAAGLADEVRGALVAITGAGVVVKKVLQVLGKILGNIAREPREIKFRVLKLANKTVAEHLVPQPGALVLLAAVGFENDGSVLSLPLESNIAAVRLAADAVAERLRRIHVRWLPALHPEAAEDALRLGSDASGAALHVGRSFDPELGGGMQLGAVSPSGGFTASFGGGSVKVDDYEVLCCALGGSVVSPLPASGGRIPPNALTGGWEADGTPLYVALCPLPSFTPARPLGLIPGKVRPGFGSAAAATAGEEHSAEEYFVLALAPGAVLAPPDGAVAARPPARRFIVSVAELLSWSPSGVEGVELDLRTATPLPPPLALAAASRAPRVLHCHDMAGGYNELADEEYRHAFAGWAQIDELCYFGHHRVCVPPAAWIESCHEHSTPIYGTLLTEHGGGSPQFFV